MRTALSVIAAVALIAAGTTLALASGGGSSHHGNAGYHQYHPKPGCGPWKTDGHAGKSGYHDGQPPKSPQRKDCPKPPDKCDDHHRFTTYGSGGHGKDDCDDDCRRYSSSKSKGKGSSKNKSRNDHDDCRSSSTLRFAPVSAA